MDDDKRAMLKIAAVFGLLFVLTVGFIASSSDDSDASDASDNPYATTQPGMEDYTPRARAPVQPSCKDVVYYVDGTAPSASITIENGSGGTDQASNRAVPVTNDDGDAGIRIGCMEPGAFLYVSAQNEGESGTISCRIEVDGTVVARSSSDGAYVITTCDGSVP